MLSPLIVADAHRVGLVAAELVRNRLAARPRLRLLLPAGGAPPEVSADGAVLVGLDELERAPDGIALLVLDRDGGVGVEDPAALLTLYRARELIVLAAGAGLAPAVRAMLEAPSSARAPASTLRDHPRLTVVCDRAAAGDLTPRPGFTSTEALVVLGHREPGISAEHRISAESRARVRHALELARRSPPRAVVLTGYTSTGGLSEAEQMKLAWDEEAAPALLEVAGRDTAENATRTLPIVLALGDVRRVTVVSSAWHVRVPYFFAPYRRYGLDVRYRASFLHGHWPRMLAEELRGARRARARRSAAYAAGPHPRSSP